MEWKTMSWTCRGCRKNIWNNRDGYIGGTHLIEIPNGLKKFRKKHLGGIIDVTTLRKVVECGFCKFTDDSVHMIEGMIRRNRNEM